MTIHYTTPFDVQFNRASESANSDYQQDLPLYLRQLKRLIFIGDVVFWSLSITFFLLVAILVVLLLSVSSMFLFLLKTTLILIPLLVIWLIAIALIHRIPEIKGLRLTKEQYPELWMTLEYQSTSLNIHPPQYIILTNQMNVRLHATSFLSFFLPSRYFLEIGLPVLSVLSEQQFNALIVSELARYSTLSNRLFPNVMRKRQLWNHLYQRVSHSKRWGIGLFQHFCDGYVPRLLGYSLPLHQEGRKLADEIASDKLSADDLSLALLRTNVYGEWIKHYFWESLWLQADKLVLPPNEVVSDLYHHLLVLDSIPKYELKDSRYDVFYINTNRYNSLLNLAQRLDYIGGEISLLNQKTVMAEYYLGRYLNKILGCLDRQWKYVNKSQWVQQYKEHQIGIQQVRLLSQKNKLTQYNANEWWKLVQLVDRYLPAQSGSVFYRLYHQSFPEEKRAHYILGKYLLSNDQPEGIKLLKNAYQALGLAGKSASLLSLYYDKNNDAESALFWKNRAIKATQEYELSEKELYQLSNKDNLVAPSSVRVSEQEMKLLGHIHQHPLVDKVWVAEKQLPIPTYGILYVMGVTTKGGWFRSARRLEQELSTMTNSQHNICIVTDRSSNRMIKRIKLVGLNIYG